MLFRLCAVFGGVYHLKRAANSVIISQQGGEPHCAGIVSGSQLFGGVYHLKRAANSVIISQQGGEPHHCAGIVSGSQRLSTEHLV
ncbi:hypothetical protein J6590_075351 [Homalodisca vitripennis]|nr:hypothetical protein J6590_075351 [Homalodisca vitripennis]